MTILAGIYGDPTFSDPIQVLSVESHPVRVLSIRSGPIRSGPIQVLLTPVDYLCSAIDRLLDIINQASTTFSIPLELESSLRPVVKCWWPRQMTQFRC